MGNKPSVKYSETQSVLLIERTTNQNVDQNQLSLVYYTESNDALELQLIASIEQLPSAADYIDLTLAVEFKQDVTDALSDVAGCKVRYDQTLSELGSVEAIDFYTTSSAYDELIDLTEDLEEG